MRAFLPFVLLLAACAGKDDDETPDTTGYTDSGPPDTDADTDTDTDADADADADADTDTDTDTDMTGDTGMAPIAIAGAYTDTYGTNHVITDTLWTIAYPGYAADEFLIRSYDNTTGAVVAENGPKNAYSAGLWSRFDWTWVGKDLFYCQSGYAEASEGDALALPVSDTTAPTTGGCGAYDFPWTLLTP